MGLKSISIKNPNIIQIIESQKIESLTLVFSTSSIVTISHRSCFSSTILNPSFFNQFHHHHQSPIVLLSPTTSFSISNDASCLSRLFHFTIRKHMFQIWTFQIPNNSDGTQWLPRTQIQHDTTQLPHIYMQFRFALQLLYPFKSKF